MDQIIDGLLPGLLQMLAALGISAMAGASAGAAVGIFLGGVGAAPGAIVGGQLGLEAGTALLTWLGLGFLAAAIGQGMGELAGVLRRAVSNAWHAPEHRYSPFEIDRAAEDLARAVGILFRLVLQGLLAYVLKNGAVSASQAAASTGRAIISGGTRAAADATLAEVSALLRKSKLPDGFVVWLERNWDDLKRNPKLAVDKTAPNSSSRSSSAVTPSELKAMRERQGSSSIGKNSGNNSRPVAEKTSHEKAAFDERTARDNIAPGKNLSAQLDRLRAEGHALERHGGSITDEQLYVRAQTGVAADGSRTRRGYTPISTAFDSDELLIHADQFLRANYLDDAIRNAEPGTLRIKVSGDTGIELGRGYIPVGKQTGLLGPLQRVDNLTNVEAWYVYDPVKTIWQTNTIYPIPVR
ncbi:DUF6861 domain-containing protein [Methylobacter sp. BlB1]|uniref:DUF6861 domain-containing protein n=1 Tax=Methylobacter sp. BlB1 TaxID=2785914 RepID=UPI001893BDFA|nr:hypothetical protein [Methylobacter sp. BlB1]MBF6650809.1 hypothetical protein [Methylobacter sp. BlB1]